MIIGANDMMLPQKMEYLVNRKITDPHGDICDICNLADGMNAFSIGERLGKLYGGIYSQGNGVAYYLVMR